jgi:diguanylate cyclase (GGDEF)-like protein
MEGASDNPRAVIAELHDFSRLLDQAAAGVAWFDADDVLRYANQWFELSYNVRAAELPTWEGMMRNCHATGRGVLIETGDIDGWIAAVQSRRRSSLMRSFESDLTDGRWLWIVETVDATGGILTLASDISDLKKREDLLRKDYDHALHTSRRDALTGLYNRRYAFEALHEAVSSPGVRGEGLLLVMMDIDHFKDCNDRHGHDVGDAVLRDLAERIRSGIRANDVAARIGGEEFLLILPDMKIDAAASLLARLQAHGAAVRGLPACTFSAGVTRFEPGDCSDTLFRRADRALYAAKHGGRNRFVIG